MFHIRRFQQSWLLELDRAIVTQLGSRYSPPTGKTFRCQRTSVNLHLPWSKSTKIPSVYLLWNQ